MAETPVIIQYFPLGENFFFLMTLSLFDRNKGKFKLKQKQNHENENERYNMR